MPAGQQHACAELGSTEIRCMRALSYRAPQCKLFLPIATAAHLTPASGRGASPSAGAEAASLVPAAAAAARQLPAAAVVAPGAALAAAVVAPRAALAAAAGRWAEDHGALQRAGGGHMEVVGRKYASERPAMAAINRRKIMGRCIGQEGGSMAG